MTGSDRRKQIVDQIRNSTTPVAGKVLAAAYDVSRQVHCDIERKIIFSFFPYSDRLYSKFYF